MYEGYSIIITSTIAVEISNLQIKTNLLSHCHSKKKEKKMHKSVYKRVTKLFSLCQFETQGLVLTYTNGNLCHSTSLKWH